MLYTEIPIDFKNKMNIYLKQIFGNSKKIDNNILSNKLLYPANLKTDHMKLKIGSQQHIEIMIELFFLLDIFHKYSIKNNIPYSLFSGNLLGFYKDIDLLVWDDDIDIIINYDHIKLLNELWENGEKPNIIWGDNWMYKNISMNSYNIILLKNKNNSNKFKIKLNTHNIEIKKKNQKDIGGLDIFTPMYNFTINGKRNKTTLYDHINVNIFNNNNNEDSTCPISTYGPVECRIFKKDIAIEILNIMYPKWKEMKHPKLF